MMRWSAALALLLAMAACSDAEERAARDWVGVVDTVNGVVRVTNPAQGAWSEGDAWQVESERRIGGDESGPGMFGSISGLEVGADGRVYVLDRQASELRIFDADGTHVRTVGRSGRGPGEFVRANGLQWMGDTLIVIDGSGSRYSLYDREGALLRSVPRPLTSFGWVFEGGVVDDMLYESGVARDDDGGFRSVIYGVPLASSPVLADTIEFPATRGPRMQPFEITTATGASSISVPFWPAGVWHIDDDGLWYGHGSEHRVLHLSLDGDTLREISTAMTPVPVTAQDRAAWREQSHVKQFEELGGTVDEARIPRERPYFRSLFTDEDGYVWVEPDIEGGASFDIFDTMGRYLGRVTTGVRREGTVKPRVRNGRLYMVGLTEDDVPYVEVLRIRK